MKKFYLNLMAVVALLCVSFGAKAVSWPANYDGVMLQGFYWDSYNGGAYGNTKWTTLTGMANELSKYFDLIWVPNSAKSTGGNGYMPIYWFTNHNSDFGSEAQLSTMISTFKSLGVGIIEDCVINHRAGATNWYNFPTETWNGKTYTMANGSICSTDECFNKDAAKANVPASYKGNPDEGEDFDGARDLDHTNATVQSHCKDYVKFLTTDRGYAGLRYDMVKGYAGYYTGMYNANANVKFSVGEYWDGSYDAVANWINETAKYNNGAGKSAAFDFPCKYQLNKALGGAGLNCSELAWKANGTTDQPAGLIHFGYQQFAVTFVDNHDTFRDGSKFASDYNVMAANAFILFSPGTPCIFYPHYYSHKTEMQKLIAARKAAGIHNMSSVNVLRVSGNIYVAEITGTKGKAIVKIGSENYTPGSGYTLAASGNNYAVWTTNGGGVDPTPIPGGDPFTVYFDNSGSNWTTPYIHYWGEGGQSEYPGVAMTKESGNIWKYTVPGGTTGILFNAGDGDATKTSDFVAQANHLYTTSGDQGVYNGSGGGGGGNDNPATPFKVYFDNTTSQWATPYIHYWGASQSEYPGVAMTKESGNVWSYTVPAGTDGILFNAGDGDATKTPDFVAKANHLYTTSGDQGVYSGAGGGGGGNDNPATPFNVYFDNTTSQWATPYIHYWGGSQSEYPGVAMSKESGNVWKYTVPAGTTGILFNAGDGDATKTSDFVAQANHLYTTSGDQGVYSGAGGGGGGGNDNPVGPGTYPATLYIMGHVNGNGWAPHQGVATTGNNGIYAWPSITIDDCGDGNGYFAFVTLLGTNGTDDEWDAIVNTSDRFGAPAKDTPITLGDTKDITYYMAGEGGNASASESWKLAAGKYAILADLAQMKLSVRKENDLPTGVGSIFDVDSDNLPVQFFNLQGVRVENPTKGIYIVVKGNKATKVVVN